MGQTTFSFEEFAIGTQPNSQTLASFASSKTVFLQMSCKLEDTKELVNEEHKQFDPGGLKRETHRFEKWMYWYSFSGGTIGLDARLVSFALVCLFCVAPVFRCRKIRL